MASAALKEAPGAPPETPAPTQLRSPAPTRDRHAAIIFGSLRPEDVAAVVALHKLSRFFPFGCEWLSTTAVLDTYVTSKSPIDTVADSIPAFSSPSTLLSMSRGASIPVAEAMTSRAAPAVTATSLQSPTISSPPSPGNASFGALLAREFSNSTTLPEQPPRSQDVFSAKDSIPSPPASVGTKPTMSWASIAKAKSSNDPNGRGGVAGTQNGIAATTNGIAFQRTTSISVKSPVANDFESTTLIVFFNEFEEEKVSSSSSAEKGKSKSLKRSNAFEPTYIYDVLSSMKHVDSVKGRQEDAEEFLGFLLDGLHEELLLAQQSKNENSRPNSPVSTADVSEWIEVGTKKSAQTRKTEVRASPVTKIFGGSMRSVLKAPGDKDSVKIEPFMTLQLDIEPDNIVSIEDALQNFAVPETISEYTSETLKTKVEASKQMNFDRFPAVLILHLKRFGFDNVSGLARKIRKHLSFGPTLRIHASISAQHQQAGRQAQQLEYRLFAVVNHHSMVADVGHYTCDVMRANAEWLRVDDESVEAVDAAEVVRERGDRQPYILFYTKPSTTSAPAPAPSPAVPAAVVVHPLVLLSAVDHFFRVANNTSKRVVGVLLGQVVGDKVNVANSYAPKEKMIGWYHTGPKLRPSDLKINELFKRYVPNPVLVIIDVRPGTTGIPTDAYFSVEEVHDDGTATTKTFAHIPSVIEAEEAEEIGVEHLLRDIKDTAVGTLSTQITDQLESLKGLHARLAEISGYLEKVLTHKLPVNHQILYNLQDILNLLPNLDGADVKKGFAVTTNDEMLVVYLSSLVRAVVALHGLVLNKITNRDEEKKEAGVVESAPAAPSVPVLGADGDAAAKSDKK
ncbi:proteasome regulatory particle subunit [Entophlyctis sp. JEL0112]|nr:proteasome regulatory particle subunit [Entophlyctis sp. JEL0112]